MKTYPEGIPDVSESPPSIEISNAIGKFVVTFGKFEFKVTMLMSLLMGAEPELVSSIANSLDIQNRCIALKGICAYQLGSADKLRAQEDLKKNADFKVLDNLFKNVQQIIETRNKIVHSDWCLDEEDTHYSHRMRYTRGREGREYGWPDLDYAHISVEIIEAETLKIENTEADLTKYVFGKFRDLIIPSTKENQQPKVSES